MKHIIGYKIFEEKNFKGGVVMIKLDIPKWDSITSIVDPDDIYRNMNMGSIINGVQTTPHVTLLYPVARNVPYEKIKSVLDRVNNIKINLTSTKIDFFDLPNYDVLVIHLDKDETLSEISKLLNNNIKNYNNLQEYNPHITIAYLKKGTAKKYCQPYKYNMKSNTIVYVTGDDTYKYSI